MFQNSVAVTFHNGNLEIAAKLEVVGGKSVKVDSLICRESKKDG